MQPAAAPLDHQTMRRLAWHYARQTPRTHPSPAPADGQLARGRTIAQHGVPEQDVPACDGCHAKIPRNAAFPTLAGQHAGYLASQLRLFRSNGRGGSAWAGLMRQAVQPLSDAQIDDVAAYYGAQPPRTAHRAPR